MRPTQRRRTHAMSRYTAVTEQLIDKCQRDYQAGHDLGRSIPGLSAVETTVIATESLEADRLLRASPKMILANPFDAMSDWNLAVLAEILFALARPTRRFFSLPKEEWNRLTDRAWAALEQALNSPTASPMLWYEDIHMDVAQEYRVKGDRQAIGLLKRGLAFNLCYHEGNNADNFLCDLAETHLWLDDLDRGLAILTALLRNDPSDAWTYNVIALTFGHFGLADLGLEVTKRGLEVIEATGDPEGLHDQFTDSLDRLYQSEQRGREAKVSPAVLADFRATFALDAEAGQPRPIAELCRDLIPDLDEIVVKSPPTMPNVPQSSPSPRSRPRRQSRPGDLKLGRNDPCWCGSGKKYKHCRRHSDLGWA
jgi:tetratricopeptide (TPR) repeat protein